MFIPNADMTCLRQGDILSAVPFPRASSGDMAILGSIDPAKSVHPIPVLSPLCHQHREDRNWLTAQVPMRICFCAVISQCCDLEPRHGRIQMPAFSVARLIPVPKGIIADPQRLESLRQNKDPRDSTDPGYINLFHIPANDLLDGQEWVVDYSQIFSIPGSEFPAVLKKKMLQMEDRWRVKFKVKLAFSFTRLTEEERTTGLENPWTVVQ